MYAVAILERPDEPRGAAVIRFPARAMNRPKGQSDVVDAAALIRAIAARHDRAAFAVLFTYYAPRLKAYMVRRGAAHELAEELAQETLLTIWRKAAQFDAARASGAAWIFAILRNLHIDQARRMRLALADATRTVEAEAPPSADAAIETARRTARLRAALAALPAEQADVVRLSFFDDRPHAEIERHLGIPLGTVKSRLRLAMARLRNLLEGDA